MFEDFLVEGYNMFKNNAIHHRENKVKKKLNWSRTHKLKTKLNAKHLEFIQMLLDEEDKH